MNDDESLPVETTKDASISRIAKGMSVFLALVFFALFWFRHTLAISLAPSLSEDSRFFVLEHVKAENTLSLFILAEIHITAIQYRGRLPTCKSESLDRIIEADKEILAPFVSKLLEHNDEDSLLLATRVITISDGKLGPKDLSLNMTEVCLKLLKSKNEEILTRTTLFCQDYWCPAMRELLTEKINDVNEPQAWGLGGDEMYWRSTVCRMLIFDCETPVEKLPTKWIDNYFAGLRWHVLKFKDGMHPRHRSLLEFILKHVVKYENAQDYYWNLHNICSALEDNIRDYGHSPDFKPTKDIIEAFSQDHPNSYLLKHILDGQ